MMTAAFGARAYLRTRSIRRCRDAVGNEILGTREMSGGIGERLGIGLIGALAMALAGLIMLLDKLLVKFPR